MSLSRWLVTTAASDRPLSRRSQPARTACARLRGVLTHLEGSESGREYPADELIGLDPADDRPLLARYDLERAARTLTREAMAERRTGGLWRWAELLPVRDA